MSEGDPRHKKSTFHKVSKKLQRMIKISQITKIKINFGYIQSDKPGFDRSVVIRDKKLLAVVIRFTFFFDDTGCLLVKFFISLNQNSFVMNLWIQVELDTLYKHASETFACFPNKNVQKPFFFQGSTFLLEFCWSVVIRDKKQLCVVFRETTPNNDRGSSLSQTADFSTKTLEQKDRQYLI